MENPQLRSPSYPEHMNRPLYHVMRDLMRLHGVDIDNPKHVEPHGLRYRLSNADVMLEYRPPASEAYQQITVTAEDLDQAMLYSQRGVEILATDINDAYQLDGCPFAPFEPWLEAFITDGKVVVVKVPGSDYAHFDVTTTYKGIQRLGPGDWVWCREDGTLGATCEAHLLASVV